MTTLNARANQAWRDEIAFESTDDEAGFSHQRAAFEEGWETGYKAAQADRPTHQQVVNALAASNLIAPGYVYLVDAPAVEIANVIVTLLNAAEVPS